MLLFSFRHSVKTFSPKRSASARQARPGQTVAHLRYILRRKAARAVVSERLPGGFPIKAAEIAEDQARKRGGRVVERFVVALPLEATPDQRVELTRAFAEALTRGRAGYIGAIHDKSGNDIRNPHFHLAVFDAHEKGGGRGRPRAVVGMARKGAVEAAAALWAETHNAAMAAWGYGAASMIDHRSFAERGIDRLPELHEGPGARRVAAKGVKPAAKAAWRGVDQGQTRAEANAVIRDINAMKEELDGRRVRLAGGDDGSANRLGAGRGVRGAGVVRDGGGSACDRPPFAAAPKDRGGDRADRRPPWGSRSGAEPHPSRRDAPAPGSAAPLVAPAGDPVRRVASSRRRRRLFAELMMLRDSLRARLASLRCAGGRGAGVERPPFLDEPDQARASARPEMKLARSEASQREL